MRPERKGPEPSALTLATVASAALGLALTVSVLSGVPLLLPSATNDPVFGALNECLLESDRPRAGFAVGRDARRVAAWTSTQLSVCELDSAGGIRRQTFPLLGGTVGAWDGLGQLWVAARGADVLRPQLWALFGAVGAPELRPMATLAPMALAGGATGVVVLEASGNLMGLNAEGQVSGLAQVPATAAGAVLTSSGDGQRVAVRTGGRLAIFDAQSLRPLRSEAPCEIEFEWWLPGGHELILACGPKRSWALAFNADTGDSEIRAQVEGGDAVLAGPEGPWVRSCDLLPCTASGPAR